MIGLRFRRNVILYFLGTAIACLGEWVYFLRWHFGNRIINCDTSDGRFDITAMNSEPIPISRWCALLLLAVVVFKVNRRSLGNGTTPSIFTALVTAVLLIGGCFGTALLLIGTYSTLR